MSGWRSIKHDSQRTRSADTAPGLNGEGASMAKIDDLLDALLSGEAITLQDSVGRWNLFALSQTIGTLKKKRKVPIETELIQMEDGEGYFRHYGQYRIAPEHLAEQRERFGR